MTEPSAPTKSSSKPKVHNPLPPDTAALFQAELQNALKKNRNNNSNKLPSSELPPIGDQSPPNAAATQLSPCNLLPLFPTTHTCEVTDIGAGETQHERVDSAVVPVDKEVRKVSSSCFVYVSTMSTLHRYVCKKVAMLSRTPTLSLIAARQVLAFVLVIVMYVHMMSTSPDFP